MDDGPALAAAANSILHPNRHRGMMFPDHFNLCDSWGSGRRVRIQLQHALRCGLAPCHGCGIAVAVVKACVGDALPVALKTNWPQQSHEARRESIDHFCLAIH